MPRGGFRPGAGRKRGSKTLPEYAQPAPKGASVPSDVMIAARAAQMSPLDYMLAVMRDPEADPIRRDRMAQAAAPFVHVKPGDSPQGKKEQAAHAARTAERGTEWEDLLN